MERPRSDILNFGDSLVLGNCTSTQSDSYLHTTFNYNVTNSSDSGFTSLVSECDTNSSPHMQRSQTSFSFSSPTELACRASNPRSVAFNFDKLCANESLEEDLLDSMFVGNLFDNETDKNRSTCQRDFLCSPLKHSNFAVNPSTSRAFQKADKDMLKGEPIKDVSQQLSPNLTTMKSCLSRVEKETGCLGYGEEIRSPKCQFCTPTSNANIYPQYNERHLPPAKTSRFVAVRQLHLASRKGPGVFYIRPRSEPLTDTSLKEEEEESNEDESDYQKPLKLGDSLTPQSLLNTYDDLTKPPPLLLASVPKRRTFNGCDVLAKPMVSDARMSYWTRSIGTQTSHYLAAGSHLPAQVRPHSAPLSKLRFAAVQENVGLSRFPCIRSSALSGPLDSNQTPFNLQASESDASDNSLSNYSIVSSSQERPTFGNGKRTALVHIPDVVPAYHEAVIPRVTSERSASVPLNSLQRGSPRRHSCTQESLAAMVQHMADIGDTLDRDRSLVNTRTLGGHAKPTLSPVVVPTTFDRCRSGGLHTRCLRWFSSGVSTLVYRPLELMRGMLSYEALFGPFNAVLSKPPECTQFGDPNFQFGFRKRCNSTLPPDVQPPSDSAVSADHDLSTYRRRTLSSIS